MKARVKKLPGELERAFDDLAALPRATTDPDVLAAAIEELRAKVTRALQRTAFCRAERRLGELLAKILKCWQSGKTLQSV